MSAQRGSQPPFVSAVSSPRPLRDVDFPPTVIQFGIMLDRCRFLAVCSQFGFASTLLPGALYHRHPGADAPAPASCRSIASKNYARNGRTGGGAGWCSPRAGSDSMMLDALNLQRDGYSAIRALHIQNSVAPAYVFDPLPQMPLCKPARSSEVRQPSDRRRTTHQP